MPDPSLPPPLRVRNPAGTFNQIPVFELEVSGATLSQLSPIRARLLIDSGAAGTSVVYAPTGGEYVTYVANNTLTAERVLTAGSSVTLVTDASAVYINALTGGGGTTVYAATGNQYVTISAAADLTDEYLIQASTGMALTSASNILFVHYGSLLVTSTRAINTTAPLAGGGNLAADRTLTADTAALVMSGRSISTLFPMAGGGDLSANRTVSVDTAFLVTSARTITTTLPLSGGGLLSANLTLTIAVANTNTTGAISAADWTTFNGKQDALVLPLGVGQGGTGVASLTAFGILYGSGASTIQAEAAMNSGSLLVGSGANMRPHILPIGGEGQILSVNSTGSVGGLKWINSQNIPQLTTIRIPMALSLVQPTTGNAYWVGRTSTGIDLGYVEYLDSGNGLATYWCTVPNNLAPSPLWNLYFYHMPSASSGGNVVLSVSALSVAAGGSTGNVAPTAIMTAVALSTRAVNILEISTGSATNFDSALTVGANNYLIVQVYRIGGSASDTVGLPWDLFGVQFRCDVLT